ncbi:MAG TPA: GDCCVxC domain-containing (seleno)protein [Rubrivivax sp.]|nr:GDCCVxC domain-containing (seleno)protein [Rubrivivax sp.]
MGAALITLPTCPCCGHAARETMPADACVYFHACSACGARLTPKPGGCCVFCSYADVKCPPKQQGEACCT